MRDDLPLSIVIRSDDLPDPELPAFYRRAPVDQVVDSATFAQDDPEGLRAQGPRAVGEALTRLALTGQTSIHRDVREISALLLAYLTDGLHHDALDLDLGLRRRDGRPGLDLIARRAERTQLIVDLSRQHPWSPMGPWAAAKAMRAAFAEYEARRWPGHRGRASRPAGADGAWWAILRMGLALPKERVIAEAIRGDRA